MWFEQGKNEVGYHILKKPYNNLFVGSDPLDGMTLEFAQSFDVFLNFCENPLYSLDSERPREDTVYHHVPVDELEFWGYKVFSDSKLILDDAFEGSKRVYIHCAAGTNRSPCMTVAWLTSRGHSLEEACSIVGGNLAELLEEKFMMNIDDLGCIPKDLDKFYKSMINLNKKP
jgi:hypothetical protein